MNVHGHNYFVEELGFVNQFADQTKTLAIPAPYSRSLTFIHGFFVFSLHELVVVRNSWDSWRDIFVASGVLTRVMRRKQMFTSLCSALYMRRVSHLDFAPGCPLTSSPTKSGRTPCRFW